MRLVAPAPIRVDGDDGPLPGTDLPELALLEVRRDPDVVEGHDGQQRLSGLDDLADLDRLLAHVTARGCLHGGIVQIEHGLGQGRPRLHDLRLGGGGPRAHDPDLLRRRLRFREVGAGGRHSRLAFSHRRLGRLQGSVGGLGGDDDRVVLLLGDLVLCDQRLQTHEVLVGLLRLGLGILPPGPRRAQAGARGADVALGAGDLAGGGGGGDGHRGPGGLGRSLRFGEIGPSVVDRELVVARIELDHDRARFDELVVGDLDRLHRAADAGGHGDDVAVDLGVVGGLAAGVMPPGEGGHDRGDDHSEHDPPRSRHHSPRRSCL